MQITFDTDKPADVAFVRQLLGIPAAPAPAPFPPIAHPTGSTQALPIGAPDGAYWVAVPGGAPSLRDKDNNVLSVDWLSTPPRVTPNPPRTPDGNGMKADDFLNIVRGETS